MGGFCVSMTRTCTGTRVRAQQHVALALDVGALAGQVAYVEGVLKRARRVVRRRLSAVKL